jgi:hypothetical protein
VGADQTAAEGHVSKPVNPGCRQTSVSLRHGQHRDNHRHSPWNRIKASFSLQLPHDVLSIDRFQLQSPVMGRGGYNGGGPSVQAPQDDDLYIFPDLHKDRLSDRSRIVQAGKNLKNEGGGVQHEFGYLLSVTTDATEEPAKVRLVSRLFCISRTSKPNQLKSDLRWIAASELLSRAPEGRELAHDYHRKNPKSPRPFGLGSE